MNLWREKTKTRKKIEQELRNSSNYMSTTATFTPWTGSSLLLYLHRERMITTFEWIMTSSSIFGQIWEHD